MRNKFLTSCAAGAMLVATGGIASAATTQGFAVDWANSSVTLTDQSGGGLACYFSSCGLGVSLTNGPTSFTLAEGGSETFDFLRWTSTSDWGTTGYGNPRSFEVSATLAFSNPVSSGSSDGTGGAYMLLGYIIGGTLTWDSIPQITAGNGSVYDLSFGGGSGWLLEGDAGYTSSATVSLVSAVPLPAAAPMLLAGMGVLGFVGRRRKKKQSA